MHIGTRLTLVNRAPIDRPTCRGRRIQFLHIPKTGGTTFRYIMEGYAAVKGLKSLNEARMMAETPGAPVDLGPARLAMGMRPYPDLLRRADTCYLTLLREPVQRLRSRISMLADRAGTGWRHQIDQLAWQEANRACHLLSGGMEAPETALLAAKSALEHKVHLFGLQEE